MQVAVTLYHSCKRDPKRPFSSSYLRVCECLRWHVWVRHAWLYLRVQQVVNTCMRVHIHTHLFIYLFSDISKLTFNILCGDCTQSPWITKLKGRVHGFIICQLENTTLMFTCWGINLFCCHDNCHSGCWACHTRGYTHTLFTLLMNVWRLFLPATGLETSFRSQKWTWG